CAPCRLASPLLYMYHPLLGFLVLLLLPLRECAFASHETEEAGMATNGRQGAAARLRPECPRCHSGDTKFCYYNNYSITQPRYHCRGCRRYWTQGGALRNVPVGGGCRNRSSSTKQRSSGNKIARSTVPLPDPAAASSSSGPTAMAASSMVNLIPTMLPAFVPPPGWGRDLVVPPTPSFLDILRSGGGLLPIDGAMPHRQNNTDYYADIGMAMPSFGGTATVHQELAVGEEGAGDGGVGDMPMPMPMAGLEWQPQLIGGVNGGIESSGFAQQHLGAGEKNVTDNDKYIINGGEGPSRDDYYWIDDDNNGGGPWQGLTNNSQ
ncbi:hypothetical protein BRADI_4g45222v3, partial [Brachypodium distachyon]